MYVLINLYIMYLFTIFSNYVFIYRKVPSKRPWALSYLPPYPTHRALVQLTGLLQVTLAIF